MSLEQNLNHAHDLDQWAVWFKKEFAPADLDANGVLAFMHHLADLGLFEFIGDAGKWRLSGIDSDSNPINIREKVLKRLETLSQTKAGFAVACFLGRQPDMSTSGKETSASDLRIAPKNIKNAPNREIASDLSNLQIVKKVGRQLQPFLEFEKATVARLLGTHTQTKEARVIFNFILRHTKTKAEPKKWEQLSRKRHK